MKTALKTAFAAAALGSALAAAPFYATAEHCRSGMGYGKPGYHSGMAQGTYKHSPGMGYGQHAYRPGMVYGSPGHYGHPIMGKGGSYGHSTYGHGYGKPMTYKMGYSTAGGNSPRQEAAAPGKDIVDIAVESGEFDTLVAAVKAAGLVETLKGDGPFTVFAPTDEAFAKIPEDQLAALLANKDALTEVLTYHVVAGAVTSSDVAKLDSAKTVQGESIEIDTSDGVRVNGAKVVTADIRASNGVIHVIGTVIMPN